MAKNNEVGVALLRIAPTLRGFVDQLREDLNKSRPAWPDVELEVKPKNLDDFVAKIRAAVQAAKDDIEIDVDANTTDATAHIDAWKQRQAQQNISLNVEVDTAAASAALAAWRAKESSKSVRQRIVVEREDRGNVGSGAQQGYSVVQNIGGISLFQLANISAALAGVNAIVAALGGVIAAAGAAGTALGAMGAVGLVGGSGIFKAFSALNQEADNLTDRATTSANEQARAMDRLQDAQRGVSDAQRGLRDSQKDYARAVQDATRAIRDQNMELQDAVLSQEDAAIGVARARERLAEVNRDARAGKASQLDVQEARLRVRTAQSRLKQSQITVSDAREDTAKVNAGGVEGHEIVQNARSRVDEQYRRLADAQRDVARATRDMASAVQQAAGPQSQFEKAMARLSPTARDFVERIRSLGPEWTKLRMATEGAMFAGLGETVQRVAGVQLPDMQRGMVALAGTMNGLLKGSLETVSATFSEFAADGTYSRFINSVQDSFKGFVPTVDALVRTLTGLTIEIGPQIGVFFQQFATFLNEGTPMWAEFGRETVAGIGGMLPTINQLFSVLLPIARELLPYFAQALQALADGLGQNQGAFAEFNSALGGAFVNLIRAAVPLLAAFARALTPILNYIADMNPAILTAVMAFGLIGAAILRTIIGLGNLIGRLGLVIGMIGRFAQSRFIVGLFGAIRGAAIGLAATLGRVAVAMRTAMMAMVATPMGKFMVGIMALGAALVLLYQRSETFRNIVTRIKNALTSLLGGSDNAQAAMVFGPLLLGFTKLSGGASLFSKALGPLKTAVTAVTVGIRAMTVAMISNPIGLIVAAVVALGVALWAFFTKTELGRKIWAGFVNFLKGAWEGFKNAFGAVVDWLQDRWNNVVSFFSDNKYVQALLNPIENLKKGFRVMVDYAKGLFSNLKRSLLEMLLAPARAIGRLFQKVPSWVPGSGRVRSFGQQLANVHVVERAEGGTIPQAVSRANNILKGPGTSTSDSILAVDGYGVPVARVSTDEGIVNAKGLKKHRGLFEAINRDDPRLANLPGYDTGGALDGSSAKQRLGPKAWDLQWQKYFREKGADTPQKAYDYMQSHPDVRDRYRKGDLPPDQGEGGWFQKMSPRKDDDKIAEDQKRRNDEQRITEVKEDEKAAADRKRARKVFDDAWFKWFESHGGDDNKNSYLARNPDVAERWKTGVFPPGDERRQEDLKFNPDGSLTEDSKPLSMDEGVGNIDLGDPAVDMGSGDSNWTPWAGPDANLNAGGSYQAEEYGLPPGTNTGGYGSSGAAFPPWVREMEAKWGVKSSTYPGHQASDRGEPGYAPNPKGLNRGIDWSGPVDALQKFAEYLLSIAPSVQGLEQIIWQNPQTGQKIGWAGRSPDTNGSYFADDYAGHQNHVHTRQSTSLPSSGAAMQAGPDPNGTGAVDMGTIDIENVDPGPDGIMGTDDDEALDTGAESVDTYTQDEWAALSPVQKLFPQLGDKKSPYAEQDRFSLPGFAASSARVGAEEALKAAGLEHSVLSGKDLWADGKTGGKKPPGYAPEKLSIPGYASSAARIVAEGFLGFFDMGNSIASGSNEYNRAVQESYDWYDEQKRNERYGKKSDSKSQYDPQTGNVGSGEAGSEKTQQLQLGYADPTQAPAVQNAMVPKQTPEGGIADGTPGAKEAVFSEWGKRGWNKDSEWFDTLRLINGESSWNATIRNPSSGAFGLFQFLGSTKDQYLPDENPNPAVQAVAGAKYISDRPDYGSPSKAYAMWKSRSPHWYADGGWVSGPGGPRDDAIDARLSDKEFVTSADSAAKAGPLLELINSSPEAAENAMNMFAGPVGAAVNAVAPGAGSAVAAGMSGAAGAVKAGARPFADKAIGFLSEIERSNFSPRHEAPAQSRLEPKKSAPPMQKSFNSGTININTLDHKSMIHELDDMQARDAMRHVNI